MKLEDLVKSLKELGLKKNDIVLLHSSLNSIGEVEGGGETVIDAFMKVLGPKGALIVPVFGKLGILTELVKARPDAFVSEIPIGTLAGIGGRARELLSGHWDTETAHGEGTPFLKIAEAGGYICLLGVDQDRNTMLHSAEALLKLPYLNTCVRTCKSPTGEEVTRKWPYYPGPHRNFIGLDHSMLENEIMKIGRVGNAQARLIDAHEMLHMAMEFGAEDPAFVLCDNPACADCVRQRALIFADRMRQEAFKLSASSRLCGRYVPEMIEKLQAEGIDQVELDYVQGKACAFMGADQLAKITAEFTEAKIGVSGLRLPVIPDELGALLDKLQKSRISRVIVPLSGDFKEYGKFVDAGIQVDFVNVSETSTNAAAKLAGYKAMNAACFVMSPSNFVRAGEMPFLKSWRVGKFSRTISQLDLVDATWDGETRTLATGNGEVKELVSILRCRNFSGWMVLGGGAPYPGDLSAAVRNFRNLLENM